MAGDDSYRRVLRAIADRAEGDARSLWQEYRGGSLTVREWTTATVAQQLQHNQQAVKAADAVLAILLAHRTGRHMAPLGIGLPDGAQDGMRRAVTDLAADLDVGDDMTGRIRRFARDDPSDTARWAWQRGMSRRDVVRGWTRSTRGSTCALCSSLDTGEILPSDVDLTRHPYCECIAKPVVKG